MKKLLILLLIIVVAGVLFFFLKGNEKPSSEPLSPDTVVQWENATFEREIREMLQMPTGDILVSDLENITTLLVYGADRTATGALPEYNMLRAEDFTLAEQQSYAELKYFQNLKSLVFYHVELLDYGFLAEMDCLKSVLFDACKLPEQEWPEENLTYLYFTSCDGTFDLRDIKNPGRFLELNFSGMELLGTEQLNLFENLTVFSADDCGITDIGFVLGCKQLKQLALAENQISSLEGIERLTNLEILLLEENPIRDVTPLLQLKQLAYLGISKETVPDWSVFEALPNCTVSDPNE